MSKGRRQRRESNDRAARKPAKFLVFGEDDNDRRSIKSLIEALCPAAAGRVELRREPLVLIKGRKEAEARSQAEKIAAAIRASAVNSEIVCSFLHEDCDAVEPARLAVSARIEEAMKKTDCPGDVHAVVPAWETEAWWFLWPEALAQVNKHWKLPKKYSSSNSGAVVDAKKTLKAELGKGQRGKNDYRESDSVAIAEKIRDLGVADTPTPGRSLSYDRFRSSVRACCPKLGA